jgi:hypothetical protein
VDRVARILEQPARDRGPPFAIDLDVDGRLGCAVANPEQVVRGALSGTIDAGIERPEWLDPAVREGQTQERSRQLAQQAAESDVGLAHARRDSTPCL